MLLCIPFIFAEVLIWLWDMMASIYFIVATLITEVLFEKLLICTAVLQTGNKAYYKWIYVTLSHLRSKGF